MRRCHNVIMVLLVSFLVCVVSTFADEKPLQASASLTFLSGMPSPEKEVVWQKFTSRQGGHWTIILDGDGYLRQAFVLNGPFLSLDPNEVDVRAFFGEELWLSAFSHELSDGLRLSDSKITPGGIYQTWQATRSNIDILWTTLIVVRAADGRVAGVINNLRPGCQGTSVPGFNKQIALERLLPSLDGTLLATNDVVLHASSGGGCLPVLSCFIAMKLEGYTMPVEHFCLINQEGEIVFRRALTVPYRRE